MEKSGGVPAKFIAKRTSFDTWSMNEAEKEKLNYSNTCNLDEDKK